MAPPTSDLYHLYPLLINKGKKGKRNFLGSLTSFIDAESIKWTNVEGPENLTVEKMNPIN